MAVSHQRGLTSAEIFATHRSRIRGYVLSMVHDPAEADDLTQEVFLRAHRKVSSLTATGLFPNPEYHALGRTQPA